MPNNAPTIANLNGDSATFVVGGGAVRLDSGTNAAITDPDPFGYEVIRVGTGLVLGPLFMVEVPDGSGRMYVVEKNAAIRILDPDTGNITLFLNVSSEVSSGGEQGLLGMALAPDFATSGVFYIYMTNTNGDNEVRRYSTFPGNMNEADPGTADRILLLSHPVAANHNAGWIGFGPDNMLYIPTGDGANGANPQSINSLLGKVLRIDPSSDAFPADPDRDYAIPAGNPFAGATPGLDEIWALGLRNPFRASFDTLTGDLWIGDVGESTREEINLAPAGQAGLNFGWPDQEGTTGPDNPAFTRPVAEYGHGSGPFQGNSVTGGLVYRGPIAGLDGQYVFADFFDELWSVPVSSLVQGSTLPSSSFTLRNTAFTPNAGTINSITSFATDQEGNLYITDLGGEVFRVQVSAAPNFAGGSLTVEIGAGEVPAEDRLGFAVGSVTLSNGTNFGSQVRVDGILVGTIAPGGTGLNGEPLVVLFSSGATQARISTLVQAVTYLNTAADPTPGTRSVTIRLNDGAGTVGGGQDTVVVTTSVNVGIDPGVVLTGTSGDDVLRGGSGNDELIGLAGNDLLIGAAGADVLRGGTGNDAYRVEDSLDLIFEAAGEGDDAVYAAVNYELNSGAHIETMGTTFGDGGGPIDLTGNEVGQSIYGNAGANRLNGAGGGDHLVGLAGNDLLIGGGGADVLRGGTGNDAYRVEDSLDLIFEAAGEGDDAVYSAISYELTAGAHVETLGTTNGDGTGEIDLTGNEFGQAIYGNAGANRLSGGGGGDVLYGLGGSDLLIGGEGADVLRGGPGNDSYRVEDGLDAIVELTGEGDDAAFAGTSFTLAAGVHVETMGTTNGDGTAAIDLAGNELGQSIFGNAGANFLDGGRGADVLTGLGGADFFAFTTALGSGNIDRIADLQAGIDRIAVDNAVFLGLDGGALPASAFRTGSAAQDADDRIIYDSSTGALFFDADGNGAGAAVQFATLQTGLSMGASDFAVI